MSSEAYEEFKTKIGPFLDLWQSGEVTCVATADSESGEYVSMATRFVFKPEPPATGSPPFVLQNERTRFLAVKVDYPRQTINQLVYQLHANGRLELEIGQYIHIVYLSRAHVRLAAAAGPPRFDWYPVSNIPRAEAQQAYGIPRRCLILQGSGELIGQLVTDETLKQIDSSLRAHRPPVDGLNGLLSKRMVGVQLYAASKAPVQVVAPLPFDMNYDPAAGLIVRAPGAAFALGIQIPIFFHPDEGSASLQLDINHSREIPEAGVREWQQPIQWPDGAEKAKAVLLYREDEIDALTFSRPSPATLPVAESLSSSDVSSSDEKGIQQQITKVNDWEKLLTTA